MSKAILIQDLTSQLIHMNFICKYHPKYEIYSDMFFDCHNSDEEPSKINLILAVSVDEKQKQLKYFHHVGEYIINGNNRVNLTQPIEGFHQFVSYQTITGKTKHIYLDPDEIAEFLKSICEKYGYTFVQTDEQIPSKIKKSNEEKRSTRESVPMLTIITLLTLTSISLHFQLIPRNWILSLILAIIFILGMQMIPHKKWLLTVGWITCQILIWIVY